MALTTDRLSLRIRNGVVSIIETAIGAGLRRAASVAAARTTLGLDGNLGVRSRIRNGNFTVNQRAVSGSVTLAANAFGHDGWKGGPSGCTYTFDKVGGITVLTITAGTLRQGIEGVLYLPEGGLYTLAWDGTAPGRMVQSGTPLTDYGPSPRTGTIAAGISATIEFGLGTLMLPRLAPGTVAALFEHREDELRRCQRYAQVIRDTLSIGGPARTDTSPLCAFQLPTEMQSTPIPSLLVAGDWWVTDGYSNDWQANPVSILFQSLTPMGGKIALQGFSGLPVGRYLSPAATQGSARILLSADI